MPNNWLQGTLRCAPLIPSVGHHRYIMDFTVFITVLSGVITFVIGQLIVKLLLDPVQDMKKTIGQVSHTLVERANVIANPGVPTKVVMDNTSDSLRKLSSQLHAYLYLVPCYDKTSKPTRFASCHLNCMHISTSFRVMTRLPKSSIFRRKKNSLLRQPPLSGY